MFINEQLFTSSECVIVSNIRRRLDSILTNEISMGPKKIRFLFLTITLLLICQFSCLNEFQLRTDSDSETTTADTETATGDTETGSPPGSCPTTVEFVSATEYTEVATCDRTGLEYIDTCPEGQVIIGFEGFLRPEGADDEAHGRLGAICGAPSIRLVDDECVVEMTASSHLPERGTSGEIEWSQICPGNKVVMGFKASTGHNIYQLSFRCAELVITGDQKNHTISRGTFVDLETIGTVDGNFQFQPDCPDGQVATGTKIDADRLPRAFALSCQTPSLPEE